MHFSDKQSDLQQGELKFLDFVQDATELSLGLELRNKGMSMIKNI